MRRFHKSGIALQYNTIKCICIYACSLCHYGWSCKNRILKIIRQYDQLFCKVDAVKKNLLQSLKCVTLLLLEFQQCQNGIALEQATPS